MRVPVLNCGQQKPTFESRVVSVHDMTASEKSELPTL